MAQSEVSLISNGATLMTLSEGAGRAPRVEGEPSSEAWKLIEGCPSSSEVWKLIEGCQSEAKVCSRVVLLSSEVEVRSRVADPGFGELVSLINQRNFNYLINLVPNNNHFRIIHTLVDTS
jgi:hypothetical protein